ncbi:hypothetical protein STSO111631_04545 [Stackebrandtia soli]
MAALRTTVPPHHITVEEIDAPASIAPHTFALAAALDTDGDVTGRLVLLHDPDGEPGWEGTLRLVTFVSAHIDEKTALDSRLSTNAWAWFTEGLRRHRAGYTAAGGTVTTTTSTPMGGLRDSRVVEATLEIRASWTPSEDTMPAQLRAWCELLWSAAGSPVGQPST